jgi:hypothetical protein
MQLAGAFSFCRPFDFLPRRPFCSLEHSLYVPAWGTGRPVSCADKVWYRSTCPYSSPRSMKSFDTLLYEHPALQVARIVLNRPETRNA